MSERDVPRANWTLATAAGVLCAKDTRNGHVRKFESVALVVPSTLTATVGSSSSVLSTAATTALPVPVVPEVSSDEKKVVAHTTSTNTIPSFGCFRIADTPSMDKQSSPQQSSKTTEQVAASIPDDRQQSDFQKVPVVASSAAAASSAKQSAKRKIQTKIR